MKKIALLLLLSQQLLAQNVTIIGIGRLGICLALCLEKIGCHVLGVDVNPEYTAQINNKTLLSNEPLVENLLQKSSNFKATTSLEEGLNFSNICFITISTTLGTEAYNFEPLNQLLTSINGLKVQNKNIILSSTITPGYITNIGKNLIKDCINTSFSYNPPFIAQGEIIKGLTQPDMILVGEANSEIGDILESLHHAISPSSHIARMSVESAEITKLAVNCFITTKIAYANFIGEIADETPNANKFDILKAAGKDSRIGSKYLLPGYGFGGPCFPRDNRGLGNYASSKNLQPLTFEATDQANKLHAEYMAKQLLEQNLDVYIFEDISYKDNSPVKIIDESQKLAVAYIIAQTGKKVTIIDNEEAIHLVQRKFGNIFTYMIRQ